ncbi:hypothetical protein [Streptomyces sp. NPDC007088]|uniref:hypothetical protein n=1 Tax=Streptomyces sp. NPDC007088 TaxID=3364773 RepID=UPI00368CDA24
MPLKWERAVLAGAAVRETPRAIVATRGRAYDVVAHQQAAMPEQLLGPEPADPEHDDQEPKPGRQEVIDMTALRVRSLARRVGADFRGFRVWCCPVPGRGPLCGRRARVLQSVTMSVVV